MHEAGSCSASSASAGLDEDLDQRRQRSRQVFSSGTPSNSSISRIAPLTFSSSERFVLSIEMRRRFSWTTVLPTLNSFSSCSMKRVLFGLAHDVLERVKLLGLGIAQTIRNCSGQAKKKKNVLWRFAGEFARQWRQARIAAIGVLLGEAIADGGGDHPAHAIGIIERFNFRRGPIGRQERIGEFGRPGPMAVSGRAAAWSPLEVSRRPQPHYRRA